MNILLLIWLGILGLLIGSFINATAGRWGTSRQNASRSKCFCCGVILRWQNLIPLLSWLYQRGRCSACYAKISPKYLFVEVAVAFIFVMCGIVSPTISMLVFNLLVVSIMALAALIDYDQFIIPHELSISLIILALLQLFISPINLDFLRPSLAHLLAGPVLAIFFWSIWLATRGKGMGFADGTLALSIGWLLGMTPGITAVMTAFWVGTVISVGLLLKQRHWRSGTLAGLGHDKIGMKTEIPFGPYLVTGFLIVMFTGWNLFSAW